MALSSRRGLTALSHLERSHPCISLSLWVYLRGVYNEMSMTQSISSSPAIPYSTNKSTMTSYDPICLRECGVSAIDCYDHGQKSSLCSGTRGARATSAERVTISAPPYYADRWSSHTGNESVPECSIPGVIVVCPRSAVYGSIVAIA